MKTIVITGATSMIGIAVLKAAVSRGVKVYAFCRKGSLNISRIPKSCLVTIVECDLDQMRDYDIKTLDLKDGIDCFYHLGWAFTDRENRDNPIKQEYNIQYTLDAVELANRMGARKFIGAGSQAEYGKSTVPLNGNTPCWPVTAYGIAKLCAGLLARKLCEENNLEYNWVRILSVYGTLDNSRTLIQSYISNCKANIPMNLGPCIHQWDFLFEEDAGEAFIAIGMKGTEGRIYCLGSGNSKPLMEYLEEIKMLVNPYYSGANYGVITYKKNDLQYLRADISELVEDTEWKPKVEFKEGIMKIISSLYTPDI